MPINNANKKTYNESMKEYKTTLRAAIYKELCSACNTYFSKVKNTDSKLYQQLPAIAGYKTESQGTSTKSNFKALTFKKGNEVVICFAGTNIKNANDILTDVKMTVSNRPPQQLKDAQEFYETIKKDYPNSKYILVGHSEGGTEGAFAKDNDAELFTYNAYGGYKFCSKQDPVNIYNYRTPGDLVSKNFTTKHVGDILTLETGKDNNIFALRDNHRLVGVNFDEEIDRMRINLQADSGFYAKSQELGITPLENDYHDTRLNRGSWSNTLQNILSNTENKSGGGPVYVNGYTKQDGTEVNSYYRSAPSR